MVMRRVIGTPELLDGPLDDRAALVGNLRDLARVNRHLGGTDLSRRALEFLAANRDEISMLDVGTGAADIPLELVESSRGRGRRLRVLGIDRRPEVLEAAVIAVPRLAATHEIELHVADGRALPYPDRSFDVAHTSLVVHHLEPDAAVALLRELARVARLGIVVNDLRRSRTAYLGAWLLAHLGTRNRLTRHDGPLSVRRAYTPDELSALLAAAGAKEVRRFRGPFGHRWSIAAVATASGAAGARAPTPTPGEAT